MSRKEKSMYDLSESKVCTEIGSRRNLSLQEKLEMAKKGLEEELDQINKALDMLKKYPEMAEFTNIISKMRI